MPISSDQMSDAIPKKCHIVVGGGASGIMLCRHLLQFDDVILIERGSSNPHSSNVITRTPSEWAAAAIKLGENITSYH
jgi:cation diffusion facilitator CzcD-associated flavoprotein CzcO